MAGVSALALFIAMFLPWFSVDARVEAPGVPAFSAEQDSLNAWQSLGVIDLVLLGIVLLAVVAVLTRRVPPLVVVGAGLLAVILILYRLADPPSVEVAFGVGEVDIGRRIGLLVALLAGAGISYGGYRAPVFRGE